MHAAYFCAAGLKEGMACVKVGPPLSASGSRRGSSLKLNPQLPSSSRLGIDGMIEPKQLSGVLFANSEPMSCTHSLSTKLRKDTIADNLPTRNGVRIPMKSGTFVPPKQTKHKRRGACVFYSFTNRRKCQGRGMIGRQAGSKSRAGSRVNRCKSTPFGVMM